MIEERSSTKDIGYYIRSVISLFVEERVMAMTLRFQSFSSSRTSRPVKPAKIFLAKEQRIPA